MPAEGRTYRGRMQKIGSALVAAACVALLASPAHAASGKVTKAEFKKVQPGWKMVRVHAVFDTAGKVIFSSEGNSEFCSLDDLWACPSESREYPAKSPYSQVTVDFVRYPSGVWRLDTKEAHWWE